MCRRFSNKRSRTEGSLNAVEEKVGGGEEVKELGKPSTWMLKSLN